MTNFNKEVYVDFTAAQIKTLSFLAYIVRIFQVNQLSLSSSIRKLKLKYSTFYTLTEDSQIHEKHLYFPLELNWFLSYLKFSEEEESVRIESVAKYSVGMGHDCWVCYYPSVFVPLTLKKNFINMTV